MAAKALSGMAWDRAKLAPIVLIRSREPLLAERAQARLRALARKVDPNVEITTLDVAGYTAGRLRVSASPSLFQERRLVQVNQLELANAALVTDLIAYLDAPVADMWLVLRHNGGNAGRKILTALTRAKVPTVACNQIKWPREKMNFLMGEVRAARRRIQPDAAQALLDAVGADLAQLAAGISQLLSETQGTVTVDDVNRYYGGRILATGFEVADSALDGDAGRALVLARHSFAAGVHPLQIVTALATKLRELALVGGGQAPTGYMPPARRQAIQRRLASWDEAGLARAICAVAQADQEVKGAARDKIYALERALRVVAARGRC